MDNTPSHLDLLESVHFYTFERHSEYFIIIGNSMIASLHLELHFQNSKME